MNELVDTVIWIHALRGRSEARRFFRRSRRRERLPLYSAITRTELLAGMRPEEELRTRQLLRRLRCIPVTKEIADKAAEYLRSHHRAGIELGDAIIAATAWSVDAKLVTLNRRHFPMRDIQVVVPYQA